MAQLTTAVGPARALFEPEHQDFRESFRRFLGDEVLPHYREWEANHVVARELYTKLAAYGFLAMAVPEEYGGPGVDDWRFNVVVKEEAATAGVADALAGAGVHSDVVLPYLMHYASDEQRERWLPGVAAGEQILAIAMTEPGTGSDLAGITTRARRNGGDYVLDGAKTFITNGSLADLVVVAARTSEGRHGGLTLFVVEDGMAGFERGKRVEKLGQHCSDTTELYFDAVRVPEANRLGEEGAAFKQLIARLVPERLMLAVGATASAERAFDLTLDYIKQRTAFGRPIGSFQNSRFVMADLKSDLEMLRCFVDRTIERHLDGVATVEEAAMCKLRSTEILSRVTDAGVQLHGGYGYTTEYPIGKAWVDARVMRIYAGTNEIMKEIIGKSLGL